MLRSSSLIVPLAMALACGGPFRSTDDFAATVDAPALVEVGAPFEVKVLVRNMADTPQTLHSLDVGDEWLAGVTVTRTSPEFDEGVHVPIDNTLSYEFMEPIPANGSLEVTLHAVGTSTGTFRGEVDVCVGGSARFRSYPLVTTVR